MNIGIGTPTARASSSSLPESVTILGATTTVTDIGERQVTAAKLTVSSSGEMSLRSATSSASSGLSLVTATFATDGSLDLSVTRKLEDERIHSLLYRFPADEMPEGIPSNPFLGTIGQSALSDLDGFESPLYWPSSTANESCPVHESICTMVNELIYEDWVGWVLQNAGPLAESARTTAEYLVFDYALPIAQAQVAYAIEIINYNVQRALQEDVPALVEWAKQTIGDPLTPAQELAFAVVNQVLDLVPVIVGWVTDLVGDPVALLQSLVAWVAQTTNCPFPDEQGQCLDDSVLETASELPGIVTPIIQSLVDFVISQVPDDPQSFASEQVQAWIAYFCYYHGICGVPGVTPPDPNSVPAPGSCGNLNMGSGGLHYVCVPGIPPLEPPPIVPPDPYSVPSPGNCGWVNLGSGGAQYVCTPAIPDPCYTHGICGPPESPPVPHDMTQVQDPVPLPVPEEATLRLPVPETSLSEEARLLDQSALVEEALPIMPDANISTVGTSSVAMDGCAVVNQDGVVSTASSSPTCLAAAPSRPLADKNRLIGYARTYARNYNPEYREFGNDCTNFVSQALAYAGWTERYGYWRDDSNWWYNHTWPHNQTWSWGGSENLKNFMALSKRGTNVRYWENVRPGDIIQVELTNYQPCTGCLGHTMIVTGQNGPGYRNLLVSYHSSDKPGRLDKRLGADFMDREQTKRYVVWRLK